MKTYFHLELTSRCNYRCEMCGSNKNRDNADLDYDASIAALQANAMVDVDGIYFNAVQLNGWGEPLLYKRLSDVVKEAKRLGYWVELITNGYLLTEDMCKSLLDAKIDSIIVSMTGIVPEVYSNFQGSGVSREQSKKNMDRVIQNLCNLCDIIKDNRNQYPTKVNLRYIRNKELGSEAHLKDYLQFWKNKGINSVTVTGLFRPELNVAKVEGKFARCLVVDRHYQVCAGGNVAPCGCDGRYDRSDKSPNILKENLSSILQSEDFIKQRLRMMSVNPAVLPDNCKLCERHKLRPFFQDEYLKQHTIYFGRPLKTLLGRPFAIGAAICVRVMRNDMLYSIYLGYLRYKSRSERKRKFQCHTVQI